MPHSPPNTFPLLPHRRRAMARIVRTHAGRPPKWTVGDTADWNINDGSRRVWSMTLAKVKQKATSPIMGHLLDFLKWHPGFEEDAEANGVLLGVEYWQQTIGIESWPKALLDKETYVSAFAEKKAPLLALRERWVERMTDFYVMFRERHRANLVTEFRGRTKKDSVDHYFQIVPLPSDFNNLDDLTKITESPVGVRVLSPSYRVALFMDPLDATAFRLSDPYNFKHLIISNGETNQDAAD